MKNLNFIIVAYILFISSLGHTGQPFKCHITSLDKTLDTWINSIPMQGHGLEHWAKYSFSYKNQYYYFDGQATIFSDAIFMTVVSSGFQADAKNTLSFGHVSDSITFNCDRIK